MKRFKLQMTDFLKCARTLKSCSWHQGSWHFPVTITELTLWDKCLPRQECPPPSSTLPPLSASSSPKQGWEQVNPMKALLTQPWKNKAASGRILCYLLWNCYSGHWLTVTLSIKDTERNEPSHPMAFHAEIVLWQACSNRTKVHDLN
jgi:hypothetical protein